MINTHPWFSFNAETALWLVKNYPTLANRKEKNGLTSLQLLAQMPSAFKTKFRESIWMKLHRHICTIYSLYRLYTTGTAKIRYKLKKIINDHADESAYFLMAKSEIFNREGRASYKLNLFIMRLG